MLLALQSGLNSELEFEADEWLAADRKRVRSMGQGGTLIFGILSPEQLAVRANRELLTDRGNFDVRREYNVFGRVHVRDAPVRPATVSRLSLDLDPWRQAAYEWFGGDGPVGAWVPSVTRPEIVGGVNYVWGASRDHLWVRNTRDVNHLDRYQRSRIRAAMRKVPSGEMGMRHLMRAILAQHYGVPIWMIARVCRDYREDVSCSR